MNQLRLSIRQGFGQIGIETQNASVDIRSPMGQLSIDQQPAQMDFHSEPGELLIDSSAAWSALGSGPHMEWLNSIYSQIPNIVLQGIAKIVEDGNRMAQITNPRNAFAELAQNALSNESSIEYVGPASYFNVKIQYEPKPAVTHIEPVKPDIQYTPMKPEFEYNPGRVEVYLKQRNWIDIQVTTYDWYR
ncbi:hypothetical protein SAMN04487970_101792 [Paenibacillus tianmuensis]|uniref:Uncharacterized protein n=1 Tax=Paenibacillus tianmuensis TaxID=624147 RepID=A0A1G4RQ20_9BACL|nr:DUF6470 family protein [Paenibacillus tianmuensis]SCW58555.1 hypothetical protein SAMN04487970_101792 [Paenibacillus tianmuensis]